MGNCQAAEVATVVVQHPGNNGKVERLNWTISAHQVMSSNPGHYVALVVNNPTPTPTPNNNASRNNKVNNNNSNNSANAPTTSSVNKHQLKLLRPTDSLHIGHVYRLITFEEVIKEFTAKKKSVKLGKLLKDSGALTLDHNNNNNSDAVRSKLDHNQIDLNGVGSSISRSVGGRRVARHHLGGGHWKPALQSIAELES